MPFAILDTRVPNHRSPGIACLFSLEQILKEKRHRSRLYRAGPMSCPQRSPRSPSSKREASEDQVSYWHSPQRTQSPLGVQSRTHSCSNVSFPKSRSVLAEVEGRKTDPRGG